MNAFNEEMSMDKSEKIGQSIIQHGKGSNRIYLMDFSPADFPDIIHEMDVLAEDNGYGKSFVKIPAHYSPLFLQAGYETEAVVPKFYSGREDALFMAKYFDPLRRRLTSNELKRFQKLLLSKGNTDIHPLDASYQLKLLTKDDAHQMAELFSQVFESYPFPVFDPSFLRHEMTANTVYFGVFHNSELVAISSAECNPKYKNAEMTDFAVLTSQRGKKIASHLLRAMEHFLIKKGYLTFYTIARLNSPSMNKTFMNLNYSYAGTLVNNTQIAGQIESMNVWYKNQLRRLGN